MVHYSSCTRTSSSQRTCPIWVAAEANQEDGCYDPALLSPHLSQAAVKRPSRRGGRNTTTTTSPLPYIVKEDDEDIFSCFDLPPVVVPQHEQQVDVDVAEEDDEDERSHSQISCKSLKSTNTATTASSNTTCRTDTTITTHQSSKMICVSPKLSSSRSSRKLRSGKKATKPNKQGTSPSSSWQTIIQLELKSKSKKKPQLFSNIALYVFVIHNCFVTGENLRIVNVFFRVY